MKLRHLITIIFLAIIGWLAQEAWLGQRGLIHTRYLIKQYQQVVVTTNTIKDKNENLQKEIKQLKTDKQWIEKQVREKLGWAKPGEVIYKFKTMKEIGKTE